jgi:hypothetical protein
MYLGKYGITFIRFDILNISVLKVGWLLKLGGIGSGDGAKGAGLVFDWAVVGTAVGDEDTAVVGKPVGDDVDVTTGAKLVGTKVGCGVVARVDGESVGVDDTVAVPVGTTVELITTVGSAVPSMLLGFTVGSAEGLLDGAVVVVDVVGTPVGAPETEVDGATVGTLVGALVGSLVGAIVGVAVSGPGLGATVGTLVGALVGSLVGAIVGVVVIGPGLGATVGTLVGGLVGSLVGAIVGVAVIGPGLGAAVARTSRPWTTNRHSVRLSSNSLVSIPPPHAQQACASVFPLSVAVRRKPAWPELTLSEVTNPSVQ